MKYLLLLLCAFLSACGVTHRVPEEFTGIWEFDLETTILAMKKMDFNDSQKKMLARILVADYKGVIKRVKLNGLTQHPGTHGAVEIRIDSLKKIDEDYIFCSSKLMANPPEPTYSRNRIENGLWKVSFIDNKLNPIPNTPDQYWRKISD